MKQARRFHFIFLVLAGCWSQPASAQTTVETCYSVNQQGYCTPRPSSVAEISPVFPVITSQGRQTTSPPVSAPSFRDRLDDAIEQASEQVGEPPIPPVLPGPWTPPSGWLSFNLPSFPAQARDAYLDSRLSVIEPQARADGRSGGAQIDSSTFVPEGRQSQREEQTRKPNDEPPVVPPSLNPGSQAPQEGNGDPVDVGTGELLLDNIDLHLSGIGLDFVLKRVYRSGSAGHRSLGFGWSHSFDQWLEFPAPECGGEVYADWHTGEGWTLRFVYDSHGAWTTETGTPFQLERRGNDYAIIAPDGIERIFASSGPLARIIDLNGNQLQLSWTSGTVPWRQTPEKRLSGVIDTLGRSINFIYDTRGYLSEVNIPSLDVQISYEVDANGDLAAFHNPSGIVERYEYDWNPAREAEPDLIPTQHVLDTCEAACGRQNPSCEIGPCGAHDFSADYWACVASCDQPLACNAACSGTCAQACEGAIPPGKLEECERSCTFGCVLPDHQREAFEQAKRLKPLVDGSTELSACIAAGGRRYPWQTPVRYPVDLPHGACLTVPAGGSAYPTQRAAYLEYLRELVLDCDPGAGGVPVEASCLEMVAPSCASQAQDLYALCGAGCVSGSSSCGSLCSALSVCAAYVEQPGQSVFADLITFDSQVCSTSWEGCLLQAFLSLIGVLTTPSHVYWTGELCHGPACASGDGWYCNTGACLSSCGQCAQDCVDALAQSCAAGVESLCGESCEDACVPALSGQCAADCEADCQVGCQNIDDVCLDACQGVSARGACVDGCVEACVNENLSQGASYGHPRALNHNLLRVIDGENRIYLENFYQMDATKPDFDRVVRQEFGGETYSFRHYDLTQPVAAVEAALEHAGDGDRVDPEAIALNVCPSLCDTKLAVPSNGPRGERWLEVTRGNYLVFGGLRGDENLPAWRVEVSSSERALDASRWYELRRVGSDTVLIHPNLPLDEVFSIRVGSKTLDLDPTGEGDLQITGDPSAADAVFSRNQEATLVRTVSGDWRVVPGKAAQGARISRAGASAPEFGAARGDQGVDVELGACRGVVAFQLLGERSSVSGEPGVLTSPYWITTWSFSNQRRMATLIGTRFDRAPGSAQPPTCLPAIPLDDPDPGCWNALAAWSNAPPEMPWPDCHQPWMTRNLGMGPAGDMPALGCDELPERPAGPALPFGPECNTRDHESYGPPTGELGRISQATVVIEPDGRAQTYYSTAAGRIVRRVLPEAGALEDWSYDDNGVLIGHKTAFGDRVCVRYDAHRNPVRVTHLPADGKWAPHGPIARTVEYQEHARPSHLHPPNAEGPPRRLVYDARHNLRELRVPDQTHGELVTTYEIDAQTGRVRSITAPDGRIDRLEYDSASGALLEVHQADGTPEHRTIRTVRDGFGRVVRLEAPGRPTEEWTLARDGRAQTHSVRISPLHATQTWTYGYDEAGLLIDILGPDHDRHFTLNGQAQIVSAHLETNLSTGVERKTTCFDIRAGRVYQSIDPEGRWTTFDRGPTGEVTRISRGRVALDGSAWQTPCASNWSDTSEAGLEIFEQFGRDSASGGLVDFHVRGPASIGLGREDNSIVFSYDGYQRLVERRTGTQMVERFGYDPEGRPIWTATFEGDVPPLPSGVTSYEPSPSDPALRLFTRRSYDLHGRTSEEHTLWFRDDAAGNRVFLGGDGWIDRSYAYDDLTRSVVVTEDDQKTTEARFDRLGRVREVVYPDGLGSRIDTWSSGGLELVQRWAPYPTPSGFLEQTISFTPAGSIERVRDSGGRSTYEAEYDDFGRRVSEWSELGARSFVWDGFGRLTEVRREGPNGLSSLYQAWVYNRNDQVVSVSDALSETVTYAYDRANRPISEVFPGGASNSTIYFEGTSLPSHQSLRGGDRRSFGYDRFGELQWSQAVRTWNDFQAALSTFERNANGLVSATMETAGSDLVIEDSIFTTYARDSRGAAVEQTSSLFPGEALAIERDWAGRAVRASRGGHSIGFSYDAAGRILARSYDATPLVTHTYAGLGEATSVTLGNGLVESRGFDHRGRVTSISAAPMFDYQNYYGEDGLLARTDETIGGAPPRSTLIEGDGWGRLARSGRALTGLPPPAGSLVSPSELSQWLAQAARLETFAYDGADHLITATRDGTSESAQIALDHSLVSWGGASVTNDGAGAPLIMPDGTALAYDGFGNVRRATAPGGQIVRFSHDAFGELVSWSIGGVTTKVDRLDGALIRLDSGSSSQWIVPGENYSPRAIISGASQTYLHAPVADRVTIATGATGAIEERAAFDAFGGVEILAPDGTPRAASSVGNAFFLTGGAWIPELRMHRLGARWYAPEMGRFTSPDPLGFFDGPNLYAYAGNHPWEMIDPLGLARQQHGAGRTIRDVAFGFGDFWLRTTTNNLSLFAYGVPVVGQWYGLYKGYKTLTGFSQLYEREGAGGVVNALNPVSQTLERGYDAMTAFESGDVRKGTESLLSTVEAGANSVFLARGLQSAAAGAISRLGAQAACPGGICSCFTEETTVDAGGIEKPIAEVRLGDRAGPELAACADPALATWREVGLRMRVVDGGEKDELEIRLLRPESWLEAHQVAAGRIIEIELEELSVRGKALVTSVGAPGHVAPGTRCPVTGWVKHTSNDVIELGLEGLEAPLRVTRHHRIYSADREGWVAAGDLQAGERLTTMHGTTQVAWLSPNALPSVDVYNLEVIGAEQYYVTAQRVLVHNNYFGTATGPALPESYWINKKAPTQVTPGTKTVNIDKPSSAGGSYHSTTHYDDYGRQIGQTHRTTHGRPDHPNPHHHRRDPVTGEKLKDPRTGSRTWPGLFGNWFGN